MAGFTWIRGKYGFLNTGRGQRQATIDLTLAMANSGLAQHILLLQTSKPTNQ